jgi:hypothetical protein
MLNPLGLWFFVHTLNLTNSRGFFNLYRIYFFYLQYLMYLWMGTSYQMLTTTQQEKVQQIERRALNHFIDDLLSVCAEQDRDTSVFNMLKEHVSC